MSEPEIGSLPLSLLQQRPLMQMLDVGGRIIDFRLAEEEGRRVRTGGYSTAALLVALC